MKRLLLLSLLFLFATPSVANEQIRLYKQYLVGMPKTFLQKAHALEDCSERYEQGTLCLQKHSLAGESAELAFRFLSDRLVSVVLMMPLNDVGKIKKMFHVLKTQFDLVLIEDGANKFDILEVSANTFNKDEFTKMIAEFENEAYQKYNIKYTFISKDEFVIQSRKSRKFSDIFKDAPLKMRAATYNVGRKDGQVIGTISFIVPGITEEYLDQNPIAEDF
ncbi:hypothetical protein [Bathymodiolus heckerae thiotrophic gill symbiont]|uniref:hypothetical protein n=1 Tax=Bathymodiolus heckerae thiotrophic gill symbiont TaxID=1052212 RepID=UPI001A210237|nr:hypothetical protein [Bathymodiolus heckerae thiotrophic gill symbiont]CAC9584467.1 hypothetical protein [uncultured Gammaproteobacteria bacterium]